MLIPLPDTKLWVERMGGGRPLICLHGGLGLDHTYFRPWLDSLAADVELIYYDHRGNGRSTQPVDWSTVDHEVWTRDIEHLRVALGMDRVILLGHSYGGYFAQEYALTYPDRLAGLILCDTAPAADYGEKVFAAAQKRATPEQLATIATGFTQPFSGSPAEFGDAYRRILPLYFQEARQERVDAVCEAMTFSPAAFNRGFIECRPHFDLRDRLEDIRSPTLILHGRHDMFVPVSEGAERLHERMPVSRMVILENSGHFPFIEEQEEFLQVVRCWIRELTCP